MTLFLVYSAKKFFHSSRFSQVGSHEEESRRTDGNVYK